MKFSLAALAVFILGMPAFGQSLSADDIARMLDEQAATPNPYAVLLNDPDPARSMGAMKIMMESGDPVLMDTALEFGLLSSDDRVQRFVVEQLLDQKPILAVTFDGTKAEELRYLRNLAVSGMGGTIEANGMAYGRWNIGEYSEKGDCWSWNGQACAIVSRPEGFFIVGRMNNVSFNGRMTVSGDGRLEGMLNIDGTGTIPTSITLLD